jgi:ribonucleoside-diphosphate reductase alpha chain
VTARAAVPVSGGSGGLAQSKVLSASEMARLKGYEGDPCSDCGQFTMVRNGTCLKCITCGTTTGLLLIYRALSAFARGFRCP